MSTIPKTMKAVRMSGPVAHYDKESLDTVMTVEEVPVPTPKHGEVRCLQCLFESAVTVFIRNLPAGACEDGLFNDKSIRSKLSSRKVWERVSGTVWCRF